ncbi:MAG: phosphatidylglycerophosphatase A [Thermodesulfovibrionales bacterium]
MGESFILKKDGSKVMTVSDRLAKVIASVVFVGYIPFAPGTWGSLVSLLFIYVCNPSLIWQFSMISFLIAIGTWACYKVESQWDKDDKRIVVDEFVGMLITMFGIHLEISNLLVGFFLFRLFDILKPFPIRNIEARFQNGIGVMLDDIVAGIFGNICLRVILIIKPF